MRTLSIHDVETGIFSALLEIEKKGAIYHLPGRYSNRRFHSPFSIFCLGCVA